MGWGEAIGKIFNWIPGRSEHRRNKIEDIKREIAQIQKRHPFSDRDAARYEFLAGELRRLEQKAKNS